MRARWYDPATGRFLSEDPIGLAGGINKYAFGGGDPINAHDPRGLDCYYEPIYGWVDRSYKDERQDLHPWVIVSSWEIIGYNLLYCDSPEEFEQQQQAGGGVGGGGGRGGSQRAASQQQGRSEETCKNARLLFYGSLALDGGFLLTGGAAGILGLGRAGALAVKGSLRTLPRVGKIEYVYAQASARRGARQVLQAAGGRSAAYSAVYAAGGEALTGSGGFSFWGLVKDALPIIGSYRAWENMRAACP